MRARGWFRRVRFAAFTLGALASMVVAGAANYPKH